MLYAKHGQLNSQSNMTDKIELPPTPSLSKQLFMSAIVLILVGIVVAIIAKVFVGLVIGLIGAVFGIGSQVTKKLPIK